MHGGSLDEKVAATIPIADGLPAPRRYAAIVAVSFGTMISVIDTGTNRVTGEVEVAGEPQEVTFAANGKTAYVTENKPQQVQTINVETGKVTGTPIDRLAGYRRTVSGFINDPNFDPNDWAKLQVYLALGVFLSSAALLGVDACPMEGFQPRAYDEVLGLPEKGYASVVLVTAGYRSAEDRYATGPKVRYPVEEVIERMS